MTGDIKNTVRGLINRKCEHCYGMIKEYKCAECHPDSGELYSSVPSTLFALSLLYSFISF